MAVIAVEGGLAALEPSLEAKQFHHINNSFPNLRQLLKLLKHIYHRKLRYILATY